MHFSHRIAAAFTAALFISSFAYADPVKPKNELTIVQGQTKHTLTDEDFRMLHLDSVEVQDPVYGGPKRYAGYWLLDVLTVAGVHNVVNTVWTFTALDGYKVEIEADEVLRLGIKPFVAVRDLDATGDWVKIKQGKEMVSPGPYYLVWQVPGPVPAGIKLPWPYQMAEISVQNSSDKDQKLFPDDAARPESAARGYKIFKLNCMSCHSINLEGGGLGPELNIPKNILEYENREFLKSFISDPNSFRAKSKMPAFKSTLSAQEINDVLDYLNWIGKHKVSE